MAFRPVEVKGTEDRNLLEFTSKETRGDKEETITMHKFSNNFILQRSKEMEHGWGWLPI